VAQNPDPPVGTRWTPPSWDAVKLGRGQVGTRSWDALRNFFLHRKFFHSPEKSIVTKFLDAIKKFLRQRHKKIMARGKNFRRDQKNFYDSVIKKL
jgi:hypothetical protein